MGSPGENFRWGPNFSGSKCGRDRVSPRAHLRDWEGEWRGGEGKAGGAAWVLWFSKEKHRG